MDADCSVPWRRLAEGLLVLEGSIDKEHLLENVLDLGLKLIPCDSTVAICDQSRRVLTCRNIADHAVREYNSYYRFKVPSPPSGPVAMRGYLRNEYVCDFALPNGMEYTLFEFQVSYRLVLALNRRSREPAFTKADFLTLRVLNEHLNRLYDLFERIQAGIHPTRDGIAGTYPVLSSREVEVGELMCRGLTAREIASVLGISIRTVETHMDHIYTKLGATGRRDAACILGRTGRHASNT